MMSLAQKKLKISSREVPVFIHAINALEVAYDAVRRTNDKKQATQVLKLIADAKIQIIWSLQETEFTQAAHWKAQGRLSLADAIALATAETYQLRLVSADHHELDPLVTANLISVEWIR